MAGKRAPQDQRREQILRAAFEVATREGIGGMSVRAVAAEARLSHALVLFYFGSKQQLVHALLDWLIETTAVLHVSDEIARLPGARERLGALLRQEIDRLGHQPRHTQLFFEYWALGTRHETIRARIGSELARYREAFRTVMEELQAAEPASFAGAAPDAMAAVALSWIHGCAVQAMIDPAHFDTERFLEAVQGMVGRGG
jgi:TetR/AcrR family transcriptional repressor of bet genes